MQDMREKYLKKKDMRENERESSNNQPTSSLHELSQKQKEKFL
jgi:hypothetical protein